jgi:hypothetical protein
MLEEAQLAQFKSMVENAQSVVVVLPEQAPIDEVATALALHLTFREMGKESRIAAVTVPSFKQPKLPGFQHLTSELGNQNLTISFNYSEEQVDKVSYHIGEESKKFYLTIKPRSGSAPLDTSTIEFSYTGASADLIVYVGVRALDDLQQLYYGYETLYQDASSISFSKTESELGALQISPTSESNLSELLTSILSALQLPVSPDTATNLLAGIEFDTQGLTTRQVGAGTFESIANLLKAGGTRQPYAEPKNGNSSGKTELLIAKNGNSNSQKKSKKPKSAVTA